MIRFDSSSIYNRALSKLKQDLDWKDIANDSVVSAMLKSNAEINAETARYAEYLFKESKWDTAQNRSSILSMANMLGYKPKRKISATGELFISTDSKIYNLSQYHGIDKLSNYLNIYNKSPITIDSNTNIVDSRGLHYIAKPSTMSVTDRYIKISIIQGIKKTASVTIDTIRSTYTNSKLNKYVYIPITIDNCENASSADTKSMFRVFVDTIVDKNIVTKEYRIVSSLLLSSSTDYDVEVYNDLYNNNLFYLKFNDDIDRGPILNLSSSTSIADIRVEYIESVGSNGNLSTLNNRFTITTNNYNGTLYGVNCTTLSGGKDDEDIDDIKVNAPISYYDNYTAGTKEAYENSILNLTLTSDEIGTEITPKKVSVYYGKSTENGETIDATIITFIANGLEDKATSMSADETYEVINKALDFYLSKIKSPQDVLVFKAPNYVKYALGINYSISSSSSVADITALTNDIQTIIDEHFGSNSDDLDFSRDYSSSDVINVINENFKGVQVDSDITLEAVQKLNWANAKRLNPSKIEETEEDTNTIHTIRIPFRFDSLFAGNKTQRGFIDYRNKAAYTLRIDFLYNKGKYSSSTSDNNVSIFLSDSNTSDRVDKSSYYIVRDTGSNSDNKIWPIEYNNSGEIIGGLTSEYSNLKTACMIENNNENCWQIPFRSQVFSDDEMLSLKTQIQNKSLSTLTSMSEYTGCIENFMIYINADYSSVDYESDMCEGFIEMDFESICAVLNLYGKSVDTQRLKCAINNNISESMWSEFLNTCDEVIHIFISMRPEDSSSVNISNNSNVVKNTVLYIDSHDTDDSNVTYDTMFSNKKLNRMISVKYKEK